MQIKVRSTSCFKQVSNFCLVQLCIISEHRSHTTDPEKISSQKKESEPEKLDKETENPSKKMSEIVKDTISQTIDQTPKGIFENEKTPDRSFDHTQINTFDKSIQHIGEKASFLTHRSLADTPIYKIARAKDSSAEKQKDDKMHNEYNRSVSERPNPTKVTINCDEPAVEEAATYEELKEGKEQKITIKHNSDWQKQEEIRASTPLPYQTLDDPQPDVNPELGHEREEDSKK